jgi:hypothetical protein
MPTPMSPTDRMPTLMPLLSLAVILMAFNFLKNDKGYPDCGE